MNVAIVICWAVLLYAWLAYPLILKLLGSKPIAVRPSEQPEGTTPEIAVIVSARDEEAHIGARLQNLLSLDYPSEKLIVRVGADGCADRTVEIVKEFASRHSSIFLHAVPERRGKSAMLKDLFAQSGEDILVFTDANTEFRPDALRKLLKRFDDPAVGGVCGRLIFISARKQNSRDSTLSCPGTPTLRHSDTPLLPHSDTSPESAYWRWETALKQRESALDSCLGANGAIYAIRRGLFWDALPDNTIIDDFVIGMKVREQGFRMVYEPEALACEMLPEQPVHEWGRRTRIGAGGYQALVLCRSCLLPRYGAFAWFFWSHKVLRWLTPHLMLALLILGWLVLLCEGKSTSFCTLASVNIITPVVLTGLLCLWASAGLLRRLGVCPAILRLVDHFMNMQAALFGGFLRYCRGNLKGYWARTPRG